ncbi:MAG: tRNA glutamyl-Q(34) synthetase GluQRS [Caulobacterales bacterium]|jgi:glutamyl-Q tRNA(Asp) synthetase
MFVTRFAPSPSGLLHLGHAFSALTVFDAAQREHGTFVLRIEDIDQTRARTEFEVAIYEDLAWLGLHWPEPVRRQSAHMEDYQAVLDRLIAQGVVYRCFKTRKELADNAANAPHELGDVVRGQPLPAAEEAARLAGGEAFAWRLWLDRCLDLPQTRDLHIRMDGAIVRAEPDLLGDAVLARKDAPASYHLASVHDDALAGVTHIIRGEDLRTAAHLHALLQALLDYPHPDYGHHRLIVGADGKRLAKRDGAASLRAMRAAGATPQDIRCLLKI